MDYLKTRAPFWKKERTPDGERWVDARASDDEAAARWERRRSAASDAGNWSGHLTGFRRRAYVSIPLRRACSGARDPPRPASCPPARSSPSTGVRPPARAYRIGCRRRGAGGRAARRSGSRSCATARLRRGADELLGHWQDDPAPRLACGMIGSRQGWREAPYVGCPATVDALAAGIVRRPTAAS